MELVAVLLADDAGMTDLGTLRLDGALFDWTYPPVHDDELVAVVVLI